MAFYTGTAISNLGNILLEIKTLNVDQIATAKAEIALIRGFISTLEESRTALTAELSQTLNRLEKSASVKLKTIDSAFTSFLTALMAPLKQADPTERAFFVRDLEKGFQSQRASQSGQDLLDLVLAPIITQLSPKHIWIPGCGEAYEAAWIGAKFPKADTHYLDIDTDALAKADKRFELLNIQNAKVSAIDLTKPEELPKDNPDLVLFFNPFVIDHSDYQSLVMILSDKKTTDSKANHYLSSLKMSQQSQTIYNNILGRMDEKNFVSVTMDLAEAHAIHNYFAHKKIPVTCYRNPYAIKNLASLILGKRNPRIEPKIYHFVILAQP